MKLIRALCLAALAVPVLATAQQKTTVPDKDAQPARIRSRNVWVSTSDDRPRLGVSISSGSKRDTLGILVSAVTPGSAAEKAGIEEGDRIAAIDGVNLRISREDLDDEEMAGIAQRRLLRELEKHKAGDVVDLRVWSGGQVKSVKATLAAPEELQPLRAMREAADNRAALGVGLGSGGSRRDTLGILVTSLSEDGPAEKAGLVEGDRIAAINGVDLRVAREDAGDGSASSARYRRLSREMEKVKVGDDVELRVYSGGQTKTVKVKAGKASEVGEGGASFFFRDGPGGQFRMARPPMAPLLPKSPTLPREPREPMMFRFDGNHGGDFNIEVDPRFRAELESRMSDLRHSLQGLGHSMPRVRVKVDGADLEDADEEPDRDGSVIAEPRVAPRFKIDPGARVTTRVIRKA